MKKIQGLDGLRAISITLVLLAHAHKTMPAVFTESFISIFLTNSKLGVRIFFVISGYLITRLLLIERDKNNTVNLKHFYIRRMLRIFPIFYLYILTILIIKWFFIPTIVDNYKGIFFASAYLWNYKHLFGPGGNEDVFFGHFWSLAMEEQFYLIWPLAFVKISEKWLIKVTILLIMLMPVIRLITYFNFPGSKGQISMMLHTGGDTILVGCLGALVDHNQNLKEKYFRFLQNPFVVTCSIIFLFIVSPLLTHRFGGMYDLPIGISLNNVCIFVFIYWTINTRSVFASLIKTTFFVQLGIISYSMYIWHLLVIRDFHFWFNKFPFNLLLTIGVGFLSYYVIEKPILRLKKKFIHV